MAADFFGLKIDGHRSLGGNVGMGAAVGGFVSAAADLAGSAHKFHTNDANLMQIHEYANFLFAYSHNLHAFAYLYY